ncbi:hypothetical protein [Pseudonocardia sp. HH130629-09]|uniref:hypothetical protein n=1 Tax=Pseudonocardia sp. HH130629-09 TaxID=1641402 RepID=UPI0006CB6EF1|nr:hypothetical protein [Pseudonocardia sp. HH130629-09]ALE86574.1 hypothetical protein XF36_28470 [Pseudonocardia sp. HH130629-09]
MRVLKSTMIGLALGVATLTSVGAGVAVAAPITPAQSPTWSYVATYANRGACEEAIAAYRGRPDTSEYRCISNGNPTQSQETSWSLYNLRY